MTEAPEARPASTVVLLRDTPEGLQTLLLKRNKALLFAGGLWVFPGGAVDPEDMDAAGGDTLLASRLAAAREAMEEAGLSPRLDDMVLLSHWTTPLVEPKRFSTWIYAAPLDADDEVVIDGGEIHEARWVTVRQAVLEHESGELGILPPTYITLRTLAAYDTVASMLSEQRTSVSPEVFPVFAQGTELPTVMFRGDAGYDNGDVNMQGPRHRSVLHEKHWNYIYSDVDAAYPRLAPV
jgi:8-oxo-dGTP pyrophosphatase MutT (NUDIX family)